MELPFRDDSGAWTPQAKRALAWALVAFEIGVVAWLAYSMYEVRLEPYAGFIEPGDDAQYYFVGTDPYYHLRAVVYSVHNFPDLLRWDPFTKFPFGTDPGQFGTLFDLVVAGAVLLTVGPDASVKQIADVLAAAPPVMGALTVIPVYLIARRLTGRIGALSAASVLAILPGEFLIRSVAAYADHHVAENLTLAIAALGIILALQRARKDADHLRAWREDPKRLLPTIGLAAFGGLGMALYIWVWPPGILFTAIATAAFVLHAFIDHVRGNDLLPLTVAGAGSLFFAFLFMAPMLPHALYTFNTFGRLQPLFALAGALVLVAVYALAEVLPRRSTLNRAVVPAAAVAFPLLALVALAFFAPSVWGGLKWGLGWITGIGVTKNILTIAEAQASDMGAIRGAYGSLYAVAVFGFVPLAWRMARRARAEDTLLIVWSLVFLIGAFNQVRFTYYFAVNVALLIGILVGTLAEIRYTALASPTRGKGKDRRRKKGASGGLDAAPQGGRYAAPVGAVAIAAILIAPAAFASEGYAPAWDRVQGWGADTNLRTWTTELDWLRENSPSTGVDLTATYERGTPSPEGAYGVLAWWDYGHWIQMVGERPPVANPFQQAAPFASLWFTSQTEEEADALLIEHAGDRHVRYVMIDDESAAGKFSAITVWAHMRNNTRGTLYSDLGTSGNLLGRETYSFAGSPATTVVMGSEYKNSMMSRLYDADAFGLHHYRLVREHPSLSVIGNVVDADNGYQPACVNTLLPTRPYCPFTLPNDWSRYLDTTDAMPVNRIANDGNIIPHDGRFYGVDVRVASPLKTFEHVAGATVEGTGADPGSVVTATVNLQTTQRAFEWSGTTTADATGAWEIVVPYSTTDPVPVAEGGTTLEATARGAYRIHQNGLLLATADVPDRDVIDGGRVTATPA